MGLRHQTVEETLYTTPVTPAALAAATNDWNIANLGNYTVIRASTDGGNYDLTGILASGIENNQSFLIFNVGATGIIKIKNNSASSAAANRIITNGDVQIKPGMGGLIWYDTASLRWRLKYIV